VNFNDLLVIKRTC